MIPFRIAHPPGVGFLLRNCLGMVCLKVVSRSSPLEKIEKFFQKNREKRLTRLPVWCIM